MTTKENAIYLKGLADGLNFDRESAEGKLILALIDLCTEMADKLEEVDEDIEYLNDYVEELDEDLGEVEEYLYGDDDDDCDCDCCSDHHAYGDYDEDHKPFDEDMCDGDCDCCDEDCCGIECPACGEMLHFSCNTKLEDLVCPKCGEKLAVLDEFEDEDDDK